MIPHPQSSNDFHASIYQAVLGLGPQGGRREVGEGSPLRPDMRRASYPFTVSRTRKPYRSTTGLHIGVCDLPLPPPRLDVSLTTDISTAGA